MLNVLKCWLKTQKQEPLDPVLVGAVCGPAAFATNDWVILRLCENKPAKVRRDSSDPPRSVRVILGDRSDSVYGETCYYACDLGYPLSKDLWSDSQIEWYERALGKVKE
jgi:hypothetical protein